jgi:hypothetical protein
LCGWPWLFNFNISLSKKYLTGTLFSPKCSGRLYG